MFKKKPVEDVTPTTEKITRQIYTETVETTGGVQTKTTTVTCSKNDIESALQKLNFDPKKFQSGGKTVTRQIIYTNSSGDKEVLEETVETFEDVDKKEADDGPLETRKVAKADTKADKVVDTNARSKKVSDKPGKFEDDCLKSHNEYRKKHGTPNLVLSNELCAYAKEWAEHLAATDGFKHRNERKYGENIYMKWSTDPTYSVSGGEAVDSWYSEIKDHTFGTEPRTLKSGHFTQVIWKDSKKLGVAWARSKTGKILVVANYDPAGNFIGKFADNVPPLKK